MKDGPEIWRAGDRITQPRWAFDANGHSFEERTGAALQEIWLEARDCMQNDMGTKEVVVLLIISDGSMKRTHAFTHLTGLKKSQEIVYHSGYNKRMNVCCVSNNRLKSICYIFS